MLFLFLKLMWILQQLQLKMKQMPAIKHPADNGPIGVRNGFNELKHLTMLWAIHHCWSKGSHFSFNCYCRGKPASILHSKEGITQSDPLAMLL